jgi:hypothetical protein
MIAAYIKAFNASSVGADLEGLDPERLGQLSFHVIGFDEATEVCVCGAQRSRAVEPRCSSVRASYVVAQWPPSPAVATLA